MACADFSRRCAFYRASRPKRFPTMPSKTLFWNWDLVVSAVVANELLDEIGDTAVLSIGGLLNRVFDLRIDS